MQAYLPDYCYNPDRKHAVEGVVIHYISCINVMPSKPFDPQANWWLLHDLNVPTEKRQMFKMPDMPERVYASYHSLIDRDGVEYLLVPEDKYAYHAGVSEFEGRKNWNSHSYGVSLLGHGKSRFTDAQYKTLGNRCVSLLDEYKFDPHWIRGHEEVSRGRKYDPGIASGNFDMQRLKAML